MSTKQTILTPEGLKKLEDELETLKVVKRKEIAERIKIARDFGDLSENAEYTAAKEEQAKMETRIAEIKKLLENVVVLDETDISTDIVNIGSTVKIHDLSEDETLVYAIVGSMEANPREFKISDQSPMGKALIGARVGETVEVQSVEPFKVKILEIN